MPTDYEWEKEARSAEIRTEELFGYEARATFHRPQYEHANYPGQELAEVERENFNATRT
jgi:hypothetical protein